MKSSPSEQPKGLFISYKPPSYSLTRYVLTVTRLSSLADNLWPSALTLALRRTSKQRALRGQEETTLSGLPLNSMKETNPYG